ncbi:S8 family serine peptidase [Lentzea tibetensis]|uniref:S8 family serine peptidase n=1 Tax=Lentzea tibetensis TaxID=2591470 RepID=A0A563ETJ6_9PSEU|nr:S8 family serine peptidase [Lentzea tibetensis]TWP51045.1 S8 family serine peptidase [Lentzea tibetensis]
MLRFIAAVSAAALAFSVAPAVAAPVEGAYLVRFDGTLTDAQRLQLRALGAKIGTFVPDEGYVVRTKNTAQLTKLSYVDRVTPYEASVDGPIMLSGTGSFLVTLVEQDEAAQRAVARKITAIGGRVETISASREHIAAVLDAGQAAKVAKMAEVLAVGAVAAPETDMAIAREAGGANYIETVGGYRGQGVRGEVMDSGLRTTHQEYRARPAIIHNGNGASTSHGTSTYGEIFASGVSGAHRGLLPEAQGIFGVYSQPDRYAHTKQLVDAAGPYRAVFQSNSWGSGLTTSYTSVSAELDRIVFDHDLLICQSQSNDGTRNSRPQAWSKNVLSVGGQYHFNTLSRTDDKWNGGASIGPAADGRIKPDVSNYYDRIDTVSSTSDTSYTTGFGGTSGATPITCGNAGLLFQMWADGVFDGAPGKKRDVFASRPHAATAKALLINTAEQFAFTGTGHDMTRTHQGWGTVSLRGAYDVAKAGGFKLPILVNETDLLTNGQTRRYTLTSNGSKPLKATLAYTDPAGSPTAPVARVNDLTLKVTAPNGTVYYGNNGLAAGNWSTPGGAPNTVDNVENVLIQAPAAGTWTVEVIGSQINVDGHRETAATDADYALVVQ